MVLVAVFLMGAVAFGGLLIVNSLAWFNTRQATHQALIRAAQDGAAELAWPEGLPLTEVSDPERPNLPAAPARHCLDPAKARAAALASLAQNLAWTGGKYVTENGRQPLTPTMVVSDTTGTYLVEVSVVNPSTLNCPHTDPPPQHPPGRNYPYQRPYVHLVVQLPMEALFGRFVVHPLYVVDVTSAIDPAGGAASEED